MEGKNDFMKMLFHCDYLEGAHPAIMQKMMQTNMEQTVGYGEDEHCAHAAQLIRTVCNAPDAAVHFLVGGTQTNFTVIAAALRPFQGVLCAQTGHINVHETGAVEACGHKVLALPDNDGKISGDQVRCACAAHWADETHEHIVQPGMVYISFPTENGTLYTKAELEDLHNACREYDIPLYVDGARMGYGLTAEGNDLTLADFAQLCDAFYIGGTKVGALFGEALVITNDKLKKDFRYMIKQQGGMLAKGRLLGIQFEALFEDGLYFEIARYANEQAYRIRDALLAKGVKMFFASTTNQQFPVLSHAQLEKLGENFSYSPWAHVDADHEAVRFCTSWATRTEYVDLLVEAIANL